MKPPKKLLKSLLREKTSCTIQHTGWTCATCFYSISEKLTNQHWQLTLYIRGGYKKKELFNLPKDVEKGYKELINILTKTV